MDSDFCRNCHRMQIRLVENTNRGSRWQDVPFRVVFVQVVCDGGTILAMEQVGHAEFVTDEYAMLCEPGNTCSNYIEREFLSSQMLADLDDATERAFRRIDGFGIGEIPDKCEYRFEQEVCEMGKEE